MSEENKAVVRRLLEEFLDSGDPAVAEQVLAPDFVDHSPSYPALGGRENIQRSVRAFREAFPDATNTVEELIGEGDVVAARWTTRGTHRRSFRGLPATRRHIEVANLGMFRLADGKVVESWDHFDALGMLAQLGYEVLRGTDADAGS